MNLQNQGRENRIVLTFDRGYGELIYRHRSFIPGSVICFRFDPSCPEEPAKILSEILKEGKVSTLGKFTVIERDRIRQRRFYEIR